MTTLRALIIASMMMTIFVSAPTGASGADQSTITLAFSADSLPGFNRNDVRAAIKVWSDTIVKELNYKESAKVIIYDSFSQLEKDWAAEKIQNLTLTAKELDHLKTAPESIFVNMVDGNLHMKYVVVARRDSNFASLEDLKGRTLILAEGFRMSLAKPWLDSLLIEQTGSLLTDWFYSVATTSKISETVLKTFFKQADAALLSLEAFKIATELNPQLDRDLVVLYESPPFIPAFAIIHPSWERSSRQSLEKTILNLHSTPAGQQVLTVFQSSRMEKLPGSALAETMAFVHNYKKQQEKLSVGKQQP